MVKHCLGCDKEFEGARQKMYCSERCYDRVRKTRGKAISSSGDWGEFTNRGNMGAVKSGVFGYVESISWGAHEKEKEPRPEEFRNTVHDPNPGWNPEKKITEFNLRMVCPICNKLSLTHRKMCNFKQDEGIIIYGTK